MSNELDKKTQTIFEQIKRIDENGNEYWSARDMSKVLEYSEYRHFKAVIEKAKKACKNSNFKIEDHFEDVLEMVVIGSGAKRKTESVKLSRYAYYLIVQNADPNKEVRKTIEEIGGTMPEELPSTDSIKKLERRVKPSDKNLSKNPNKLSE
ncbi:MAG: hypothetical protein K8R37_09070 [Bacteroidales bacterium]|nr:hypothetical protein [Bacteroidales bacterium]